MTRNARIAVAVVEALLAASALGFLTAGILVAVASTAVVEPTEKARVLAQTISEAMNCIAMYPVFTLPVAVFLAWTRADAKTRARVALAGLAGLLLAFAVTAAWSGLWGHVPAGASEAQRGSITAATFAAAIYNGSLLAMLTVPGACALGWRSRKRVGESDAREP
ncbi:MAG: hypothetical protein ACLQVI_37200 [Polyangiaceae bacterium]